MLGTGGDAEELAGPTSIAPAAEAEETCPAGGDEPACAERTGVGDGAESDVAGAHASEDSDVAEPKVGDGAETRGAAEDDEGKAADGAVEPPEVFNVQGAATTGRSTWFLPNAAADGGYPATTT